MKTKERTLTATEFRAKCFSILDHLEPEGILVTKRGKAVARVTPIFRWDKFYGSMKGKVLIKGNIFSTGRKWNAQR